MAGQAFRKFLSFFVQVLVKKSAAETSQWRHYASIKKLQGKVLQATVVVAGLGSKGRGREIQSVTNKVGDKFLLPEYGRTKVVLVDKDYFSFGRGDIL
ncbi:10 kDa heat shock protein, mitochondrial-like [Cervus elaphus]|uniref:10 kDa heat shock protein, mitochondrial-like n=1 Tax=Cervus elaphus TaxID=9860 RepID=UPI001CC32108|nr:10 kDa heat shock protein, mitochondrial-like [Cervus elaphus]